MYVTLPPYLTSNSIRKEENNMLRTGINAIKHKAATGYQILDDLWKKYSEKEDEKIKAMEKKKTRIQSPAKSSQPTTYR